MTKSKSITTFLALFSSVIIPWFASAQLNVMTSGNVGVNTSTATYNSNLTVVGSGNHNILEIDGSSIHQTGQSGIHVDVNWWKTYNPLSYYAASWGATTFEVNAGGAVWCSGGYYFSDSNLKSNVAPISNALWKVTHLQGVSYLMHLPNQPDSVRGSAPPVMDSTPIDSQPQIGFLAQQVQRVVPEVVRTSPNGIMGISYPNLTALLAEAIKAQQGEIVAGQLGEDSLKTKIQNLKDSLGSQIAALKTSLQISKDSITLLQTEENNTASRVELVNDSLRTVITLMQTQENNTALRVELVNDSNRTVITALQTQENNTAIRMEFIKDSLAWQTVQLQFLTANILNSIRQMRDSLIATFACNCNGTGGGTPDDARFGGSLGQNSPNPFNSQTTITYSLTGSISSASINVYNTEGILELTTTLTAQAGSGYIKVSANSLSPGTYIYNLVVNNTQVDSKEMVITN